MLPPRPLRYPARWQPMHATALSALLLALLLLLPCAARWMHGFLGPGVHGGEGAWVHGQPSDFQRSPQPSQASAAQRSPAQRLRVHPRPRGPLEDPAMGPRRSNPGQQGFVRMASHCLSSAPAGLRPRCLPHAWYPQACSVEPAPSNELRPSDRMHACPAPCQLPCCSHMLLPAPRSPGQAPRSPPRTHAGMQSPLRVPCCCARACRCTRARSPCLRGRAWGLPPPRPRDPPTRALAQAAGLGPPPTQAGPVSALLRMCMCMHGTCTHAPACTCIHALWHALCMGMRMCMCKCIPTQHWKDVCVGAMAPPGGLQWALQCPPGARLHTDQC